VTAAAGSTAAAASRPGRQRSRAVDATIVAAALDLLLERGYGELTMTSVIERSGVSSATLYRRWATKADLVAAAVDSLVPERLDVDTGSLRGDVDAFLAHVADAIAVRGALTGDLGLEAVRRPELAAALRDKVLRPRLVDLGVLLDRAVARGELARVPDVEAALSLVVGAVHHRACVMSDTMSPEFLRSAVAGALAALLDAGGVPVEGPASGAAAAG
jgi:AcrR family transcriptional regulator